MQQTYGGNRSKGGRNIQAQNEQPGQQLNMRSKKRQMNQVTDNVFANKHTKGVKVNYNPNLGTSMMIPLSKSKDNNGAGSKHKLFENPHTMSKQGSFQRPILGDIQQNENGSG